MKDNAFINDSSFKKLNLLNKTNNIEQKIRNMGREYIKKQALTSSTKAQLNQIALCVLNF